MNSKISFSLLILVLLSLPLQSWPVMPEIQSQQLSSTRIEILQNKAKQGDPDSQNILGVCYFKGENVLKDYQKAFYWYQLAAEQSDAAAQYNLGILYSNGQGIAKDTKKALYWFQKSAEQDFPDAQISLGALYSNGQIVPKDNTQALYWFQKAAEHAVPLNNFLWSDYYIRLGHPQDYQQVVAWYQQAAKQGHQQAQCTLGDMYYHAQAQDESGTYFHGQWIPKDKQKALYWYTKSAEQGNTDAQYQVGHMYGDGNGIQQDAQKAYQWISLSAIKNPHNAVLADTYKHSLTPSQVQQAQAWVRRWKPTIKKASISP